MTPGHEPVVRVVQVGEAVTHFKVGDRLLVQADWKHLRTSKSNGAFGYNFDGALEEYVVVDERCDGAIRSTFADCLFGGRPQNGRVVGGVGGCDGRCGRQPEHGGRKNRGAEGSDDGSCPHECNSSSVWG